MHHVVEQDIIQSIPSCQAREYSPDSRSNSDIRATSNLRIRMVITIKGAACKKRRRDSFPVVQVYARLVVRARPETRIHR